MAAAAHPVVLRWAMSNGCPVCPRTTAAAARAGDLELLQWLHRSGVPLAGQDIVLAAAARGDLAMLRWAAATGADDTVHRALATWTWSGGSWRAGCPSRKLTDDELGLARDGQTCVASAETLQMLRNARMCGY